MGDGADGVHEGVGGTVLDQEAAGSGTQGVHDVCVQVEGGQDDDAAR